jgi:hypothetical protein
MWAARGSQRSPPVRNPVAPPVPRPSPAHGPDRRQPPSHGCRENPAPRETPRPRRGRRPRRGSCLPGAAWPSRAVAAAGRPEAPAAHSAPGFPDRSGPQRCRPPRRPPRRAPPDAAGWPAEAPAGADQPRIPTPNRTTQIHPREADTNSTTVLPRGPTRALDLTTSQTGRLSGRPAGRDVTSCGPRSHPTARSRKPAAVRGSEARPTPSLQSPGRGSPGSWRS